MADVRRVCLLTGAGGRLGSDFCKRYASFYDIVAVCRHRPPPTATQHEWSLDPLGARSFVGEPTVFTITADLTEPGAVDRVVELTLARHGRVDVLVNAAALVRRERLTSLAEDSAFLDEAFKLNATVPTRLAAVLARECWIAEPNANRTANRNVVNVSSGAGLGIVDAPGLAAYSASKVALNFLTCYLSGELYGLGIRVNAIAPTTFPDLVPTERVTDEIVALDASEQTGQIIEIL
jgi:NAD(P)-dependent dehydrogenase (short-subunit alcohol dehydrogenase family)